MRQPGRWPVRGSSKQPTANPRDFLDVASSSLFDKSSRFRRTKVDLEKGEDSRPRRIGGLIPAVSFTLPIPAFLINQAGHPFSRACMRLDITRSYRSCQPYVQPSSQLAASRQSSKSLSRFARHPSSRLVIQRSIKRAIHSPGHVCG